ncbi:MAG: aldo/keto reductase [Bryobacteraceae bacterium]
MTFGSQAGESEAGRIIGRCIDSGVNFIDTANVYNAGLSETITGKALRGRRDRVVLASKVRGKMGEGPDEQGLRPSAIFRAVDESLRRLGTDWLDIYYLHQPDYAAPLEDTLEAMERLVQAGKVRYPASSNYASWQVARMLWIAEKNSYKPATITQPMYNLIARGIEQEYLPMTRQFGVGTIAYNPLAGGLLTGKQPRQSPLQGTRFDNNPMYLNRYWHDPAFHAVESLREVAARAGRSLVSLSLNWLLHHTSIDCIILGASRIEQLDENLKALEDGPLTAGTLEACDRIWTELRGITPQYNR